MRRTLQAVVTAVLAGSMTGVLAVILFALPAPGSTADRPPAGVSLVAVPACESVVYWGMPVPADLTTTGCTDTIGGWHRVAGQPCDDGSTLLTFRQHSSWYWGRTGAWWGGSRTEQDPRYLRDLAGCSARSAPPVASRSRPAVELLDWPALVQCESSGDPRAVSPTGRYRGLVQFSLSSWREVGMTGDPIDYPAVVQLRAAYRLYARQGRGAWPVCGKLL